MVQTKKFLTFSLTEVYIDVYVQGLSIKMMAYALKVCELLWRFEQIPHSLKVISPKRSDFRQSTA